jgi:hypothetical protein
VIKFWALTKNLTLQILGQAINGIYITILLNIQKLNLVILQVVFLWWIRLVNLKYSVFMSLILKIGIVPTHLDYQEQIVLDQMQLVGLCNNRCNNLILIVIETFYLLINLFKNLCQLQMFKKCMEWKNKLLTVKLLIPVYFQQH